MSNWQGALRPGLVGEARLMVTFEHTAAAEGNDDVAVFATPRMVELIELACYLAVREHLPPDTRIVGVHNVIRHLAPTPVGLEVRARAELIEVAGPRLRFRVEVHDEVEKIGEGEHVDYVVSWARFRRRIDAKRRPHSTTPPPEGPSAP